jgi:hypothetical protein
VAVRAEAHDYKQLEQLCRYITSPTLSDVEVQLCIAGRAGLRLNTSWRRVHNRVGS